MSRYIDADALIKAVEDFPNCYNGWSDTYDKAFIIGAIEEAPTIDAVSVVRCKECKSWKWIEWAKEYRCVLRNTAFNARADDFCSYGEREGE